MHGDSWNLTDTQQERITIWSGEVNMCSTLLIVHATRATREMFSALISSNHSDCSQQKINLIFCQSCCQLLKIWSFSLFHTHFFPPSLSHLRFRPRLIKMERKGFAVSYSGQLWVEVNYRVQWIIGRTFSAGFGRSQTAESRWTYDWVKINIVFKHNLDLLFYYKKTTGLGNEATGNITKWQHWYWSSR